MSMRTAAAAIVGLSVLLVASFSMAQEAPSDLPPPALTLGAQAGDGLFEGFGDILAPVYLTKSGLWFVNPRLTITDEDEEELNVGLGYRHLFPEKNIILGGNIYYDSRWTTYDNHFNQLGLGVEFLSEWVDARANYYLPEDDEELADSYRDTDVQVSSSTHTYWRDPYAIQNRIEQRGTRVTRTTTTTTTYLFEMFEQAREGWDAEIGVKLPGLDQWADVKVFGGYYSWDGDYAGTEKIEGAKGRVEIHALPALYLDAAIFEDEELNGSDWTAGARLSLPFEIDKISKGENPFEGAFAKAEPSFANRLLEMVMRDLHVRTEASPWEENEEARQVDRQTRTRKRSLRDTLMDDIIFVDGDDGNDGNDGTAENPKETIQNGVDNAFGDRNVYVYGGDYNENVVLNNAASDTKLYGEGCAIQGNGGKDFGGGNYPVVDGTVVNSLPCFRVVDADNVMIRGFEVMHSGLLAPVVNDGLFAVYNISFAGIEAENADNLSLRCNRAHDNSYGALILADGTVPTGVFDYNVSLRNNDFVNNGQDGVLFDVRGASGTFMLESRGNDYSGNNQDGIDVNAQNFDAVFLMFQNDRANGSLNADGFDFEGVDNNDFVALAMQNIQANGNWNDGIDGDLMDNSLVAQGTFLGFFDGIRAIGNGADGLNLNVIANAGPAMALITDGRFNQNFGQGIDLDLTSQNFALAAIGPDGAFFQALGMSMPFMGGDIRGSGLVTANDNGSDGIEVDITAPNAALAAFLDVQANFNGWNVGGDGIDVECTANNGIAGAVFIPSAQLMGAAQVVVDLITTLLGVPSINLPQAQYHGPIQAINNTDSGIDLTATGFTAAFGGFFDVAAWLNGVDGVTAVLDSTLAPADGVAVGVFGGVDAWNNFDDGIDLTMRSRDFSLGAFVDVWAEDNTTDGVQADIRSEGTAIALMTSTRLVGGLLDLIGLPFDLGLNGGGPNEFSRNGVNGLDLDLTGQDMALALITDARANDNDNNGFDLLLNSVGGGSGDAIGLLYDVRALDNDNSGIWATLNADETALAALVDFRANDNDNFGVYCDLNSANGTAIGLMATTRLVEDLLGGLGLGGIDLGGQGANQANDNGNMGIDLDMAGDTAVGIVLDTVANDNDNFGFYISGVADNGSAIGALWRVDALRNDNSGINLDLTGSDDAYGILADFRANDNGNFGVNADIEGTAGTAVGVAGTTRLVDELIGALGGSLPINTRGPNQANDNDNTGFSLDLVGDTTVGVVLDTVANDNGNFGFYVDSVADVNNAIGVLWRVDALRNNNTGIYLDLTGDDDVYGVLADFRANDNGNFGVYADLEAVSGSAYGIVGTTDLIDWALNLLGAPFSLAEAGIRTFGPNEANNNDNTGFYMDVDAVDQAIVGVLDTVANDNGNFGMYLDADVTVGDFYGALAQVRAHRNDNDGIYADFTGPDDMIGIFYDVQARDNANDGLRVNLESTGDGVYGAFLDISTHRNGLDGIDVTLNANTEVIAAFTAIESESNGGYGMQVNADQTAAARAITLFMGPAGFEDFADLLDTLGYVTIPPEIIALAPRGRLHLNDNGLDGLYVDADAVGAGSSIDIAVDRAKANRNGQNGLNIEANAAGIVNTIVSGNHASDNTLSGIRLALVGGTAVNVLGFGNTARANGVDGIQINAAGPVLNLDFGGGLFASPGLNAMNGNGGLGLNNAGVGGAVSAENNWWGGGAPLFGTDYGAGVTPPLTWLNQAP